MFTRDYRIDFPSVDAGWLDRDRWTGGVPARHLVIDSERDYSEATAAASYDADTFTSVYFPKQRFRVDEILQGSPVKFINSTLTLRIGKLADYIYAAASCHLIAVARATGESLRHRSQDDAWKSIAERHGGCANAKLLAEWNGVVEQQHKVRATRQ